MKHEEPIAVAFGKRLREVRKERGLSVHKLAQTTGMYESDIGRYEKGGRDPQLSTILRFARGLGIEPGELLDPLADD